MANDKQKAGIAITASLATMCYMLLLWLPSAVRTPIFVSRALLVVSILASVVVLAVFVNLFAILCQD